MSECRNGSLLSHNRITSRASGARGKSVLGTGGRHSLEHKVVKVTERLNYVLHVRITASVTGVGGGSARLAGSLNHNLGIIVSECLALGDITGITGLGSNTRRLSPVVTGSLTVGVSAASAGAGNGTGGQGHAVSECLAPSLITYGTRLGCLAGSVHESMRKGLSLLSSAKRTGLSHLTGGLGPRVFAYLLAGLIIVAEDAADGVTGSEYEQKDH
jgi:hypothetical protein